VAKSKKMIKKIFLFFQKRKIISLIILLTIISMIGYCSTLTGKIGNSASNWMPSAYHFLIFFSFTFFLFLTISNEKINAKIILAVILISLITAILDETHQIFVLFRDAGIKDVLTDFVGSISAMILFLLLKNLVKKIIKK
jgi:hypothetical protein